MILDQLWSWLEEPNIRAAVILGVFYIIAHIFVFVLEKYVFKFAKRTKTQIDDLIFRKVDKPIFYLIILYGLKIAGMNLKLSESVYSGFEKVISSVMILIVTFTVAGLADIIISEWGRKFAHKTKSDLDDALVVLFQRASKVVIFVLGVLYVLDLWGIEVGPLLASLGIAGLAVAFALQSTLGNIFGGISILIDKSVKVGDRIKLETGETGIVLDVGLRSTKIRTWTNEVIVVPNGKLADMRVENFAFTDRKARVDIEFGVAYGSNVDKVDKVVTDAVSKVKGCLKDPAPCVDFLKMGDSALLFRAKFWVKDVDERHKAMLEANKLIYNTLNKEKIIIPFPQMDVHLYKEK